MHIIKCFEYPIHRTEKQIVGEENITFMSKEFLYREISRNAIDLDTIQDSNIIIDYVIK